MSEQTSSLFTFLRYKWRRQMVRHPLTGQRLWRIRFGMRLGEIQYRLDKVRGRV